MQEKTEIILIEDDKWVRAYEETFGVPMPRVGRDGSVEGLPAPFPREMDGVVRSGDPIFEPAVEAEETGSRC